jgi:hypothetical protein
MALEDLVVHLVVVNGVDIAWDFLLGSSSAKDY